MEVSAGLLEQQPVGCPLHRSVLVKRHRVRRIGPGFDGRHRVFVEGIDKPLTMSGRYAKRLAERLHVGPKSVG
ncbi:MAG: LytTR family transcriptional regulator DNA-binding domain-containing protein [Acidobacteriota bacterium]